MTGAGWRGLGGMRAAIASRISGGQSRKRSGVTRDMEVRSFRVVLYDYLFEEGATVDR
ncbi:hypothetical protein L839_0224 [Mycobacterium avium MAV_120809_2495]|nr:hypothetical protein L839_0224 [Mycobacterium avium MAV_120809_2495]